MATSIYPIIIIKSLLLYFDTERLFNQVRVKSKRTEIATFVFWRSYVSRILKKPGADWLSAGYDTCEVFVCDRLMR